MVSFFFGWNIENQLQFFFHVWYNVLMLSSVANYLSHYICSFSHVVTVFNVCPYDISIDIPDLASMRLELHPVQVTNCSPQFLLLRWYPLLVNMHLGYQSVVELRENLNIWLLFSFLQVNSTDAVVTQSGYESATGRFTVPRRTTAVFVEPRCW